MQIFHALFEGRASITRTVTALDNGVDTLTESSDPGVTSLLQTHVAAMVARVEQARPIHQRDPLFREIFRNASKIEVRVEHTARGVRVIETSTDPYVVRLIKAHAEVVDRFIANGHAEMMRDHPVPGPVPEPASEAAAPAAGHVH
jgi:hypothetical protein